MMVFIKAFGKIEFEGVEHLNPLRASLIVGNHPTLVDIVAIGSKIPYFNCIVKTELFNHKFFGSILRHCEFVPNVGGQEFIEFCKRGFKDNRPLVIFPEGTRTVQGKSVSFQRGAAQIAIRTGVPIVPVVITSNPPTLMKGNPWYKVPAKAPHLKVRFMPDLVLPDSVFKSSQISLQVRELTRYMEDFFKKELGEK
jgi:1-acyl-sn-glycerol-3-phosphate acyltransferase